MLAQRVEEADTRLDLHDAGHAVDREADRYRVGSARYQRNRFSDGTL
jgi:hypothetical protein